METPFKTLEQMLTDPIRSAVDGVINTLSGQIGPPLTIAMTIYVCFLGFRIMYGQSQQPMWDFLMMAVKCVVIAALVTRADLYREWVYGIFQEGIADGLSRAVSGSRVPDGSALDTTFSRIVGLGSGILDGISAWSPGKAALRIILAVIVWGVGLAFCIVLFSTMMWAKAGFLFVFGLGPAFIACGLFDATKGFKQAWLNQVAAFTILQVLAALVLAVFVNGVDGAINRVNVGGSRLGPELLGVVALMVFLALMAAKIWPLSGMLAGGQMALAGRSVGQAAAGAMMSAKAAGVAAYRTGVAASESASGRRGEARERMDTARGQQAAYAARAGDLLAQGDVQGATQAQYQASLAGQVADNAQRYLHETDGRKAVRAVADAALETGRQVVGSDRAAGAYKTGENVVDAQRQVAALRAAAGEMRGSSQAAGLAAGVAVASGGGGSARGYGPGPDGFPRFSSGVEAAEGGGRAVETAGMASAGSGFELSAADSGGADRDVAQEWVAGEPPREDDLQASSGGTATDGATAGTAADGARESSRTASQQAGRVETADRDNWVPGEAPRENDVGAQATWRGDEDDKGGAR